MANPLLALQVQPANIDVAGSIARGQEMKTARLGNLLQQYKLKQAQESDQRSNSLAALYNEIGPGLASGDEGAINQLAAVDPETALGYREKGLAMQKTQGDIKKQDIEVANERAEFIGRAATGILEAPADARPLLYQRARQQAKNLGIDVSGAPQQYDETAVRGMMDNAISVKDQLAAQLAQDNAAYTQEKDARDFQYRQGNDAANRGVTIRGQNLTDARAKQNNQILAGSDPVVQSWLSAVTSGNATMQQVPAAYRNSVALALDGAPGAAEKYSPLSASRMTMASSRITAPFTKMAQYELTANGLPYLQRIDAALKHPGSVSDQDLLDSLTKLNTGGNAVTEAQVRLITDGKSWSDSVGTAMNKVKNGGVLSDNQRKQIKDIANDIYDNYKKGYQPVYEQATKQLTEAGIPEAFWTITDLNKINEVQSEAFAAPSASQPSAAAPKEGQFQEGQIYKDANGNRAKFQGGKWIEVP